MTRAALFTANAMSGRVLPQDTLGFPRLTIWSLDTDVFVVITFIVNGTRRHAVFFSHVELFQYLVPIRLLAQKDRPVNLTLDLHTEAVLKRTNCDFKFLLQ